MSFGVVWRGLRRGVRLAREVGGNSRMPPVTSMRQSEWCTSRWWRPQSATQLVRLVDPPSAQWIT